MGSNSPEWYFANFWALVFLNLVKFFNTILLISVVWERPFSSYKIYNRQLL